MAKRRTVALADHLSGKRRWTRQPRVIDVVCIGEGARFRGRTIDVSRGGMLVEAHDDTLPPVGDDGLVPWAYLCAIAFAKGMEVVLGPDLTVNAEVIRVTTSPIDRRFLRLGCRFRRTLTRKQCAQIGIDETDTPDPTSGLGLETTMDVWATTEPS